MADGFKFGDWFSSDDKAKNFHRITVPNNSLMEDAGLYSFNSGTLFKVLLSDKNICVSGDEAVFDPSGGIPYDSGFALKTYNKILNTAPSVDLAVIKFWWNGEILKPLTNYDDVIHSGERVLGAIKSHEEFVLLPSGAGDKWFERKSFARDVQTSLAGSGISWEVPLCFHFGESGGPFWTTLAAQDHLMRPS